MRLKMTVTNMRTARNRRRLAGDLPDQEGAGRPTASSHHNNRKSASGFPKSQ
jgi:hypothetical protein